MARCMHSYYPTTHTHPLCSNQRMYWAVSAQLFCISQFMLKIIFILYAQSNNNFGFCSNSMLHRNMCTFMNVVFLAVVVAVVDCWLLVCARVYKYNIIILEKYKCYLAKIMFYYDYYCEILVGWHRMLMKRAERMGTAENTESMRMNFHSFRTWMNVGYCSDAEQCLCISTPSWKVSNILAIRSMCGLWSGVCVWGRHCRVEKSFFFIFKRYRLWWYHVRKWKWRMKQYKPALNGVCFCSNIA